jgi:hypothetical protein
MPIWRPSLRQGPGDSEAKAARADTQVEARTKAAGSEIEASREG